MDRILFLGDNTGERILKKRFPTPSPRTPRCYFPSLVYSSHTVLGPGPCSLFVDLSRRPGCGSPAVAPWDVGGQSDKRQNAAPWSSCFSPVSPQLKGSAGFTQHFQTFLPQAVHIPSLFSVAFIEHCAVHRMCTISFQFLQPPCEGDAAVNPLGG